MLSRSCIYYSKMSSLKSLLVRKSTIYVERIRCYFWHIINTVNACQGSFHKECNRMAFTTTMPAGRSQIPPPPYVCIWQNFKILKECNPDINGIKFSKYFEIAKRMVNTKNSCCLDEQQDMIYPWYIHPKSRKSKTFW